MTFFGQLEVQKIVILEIELHKNMMPFFFCGPTYIYSYMWDNIL